jgi:predicted house-cleaning NTP pyrophosphatase (Maf/HAM1 superfamily)
VKPIILGTSCEARIVLLAERGWDFRIVRPAPDESTDFERFTPDVLCRSLALRKAHGVVDQATDQQLTEEFVVTSSRIVVNGQSILERPQSADHIQAQLTVDSKILTVFSGVCISNRNLNAYLTESEHVDIVLPEFSEDDLSQIVTQGEGFNYLDMIVRKQPPFDRLKPIINGDETCVVGLPLQTVKTALQMSQYPIQQLP